MDEPELRVLLVLGTSTGGIGQHVRSLAAGLVQRGHQVVVAGPSQTDTLFAFSACGARFVAAAIGVTPGPRDLHTARALGPWVKGADVVHAHGFRAGLVALSAGAGSAWSIAGVRSHQVPLVMTWHNQVLASGLKGRLMHGVESMVARGADLSLGASADLVEQALAAGGAAELGAVAAPRPGPAIHDRAEIRRSLGLADQPLVLAVGRLHQQKDYPTLVAAIKLLQQHVPHPVLVVAGDGPEEAALKRLVDEQQVTASFLGRRDDVGDLLRAADVLALSSVWEARALVVQEAMQVGLPVVATSVGGLPELVGADGLLVPPGSPPAMAEALGSVLDNPDEAKARASRAKARAGRWPDEDDVVANVTRVYRRLLANRGSCMRGKHEA